MDYTTIFDLSASNILTLLSVFFFVVLCGATGVAFFMGRRQLLWQQQQKANRARHEAHARAKVAKLEAQRQAKLSVLGTSTSKRRPVVLLVDDSETVLIGTQRLLEGSGYRVITANNGREAWSILQDCKPDIIISDIEMPQVNGYQLLRLVQEDLSMADVPVILMTAHLSYDVREGVREGARGFLNKPYEQRDLLDQLDFLLQEDHGKSESQEPNSNVVKLHKGGLQRVG